MVSSDNMRRAKRRENSPAQDRYDAEFVAQTKGRGKAQTRWAGGWEGCTTPSNATSRSCRASHNPLRGHMQLLRQRAAAVGSAVSLYQRFAMTLTHANSGFMNA